MITRKTYIACGIALVTLASLSIAGADVPRKAPLVKYTGLWTNSPFTSKPPPAEAVQQNNPLDDFTLTGIAPVPGGHRITMISKKNPELKKVIEPGGSDQEFTVVSVNRDPNKLLGTSVVLSTGGMQGTVSFEPELITLKAAPAAVPQRNLPPGVSPEQANQAQAADGQAPQRQPRPRIVPPPSNPATATPAQPTKQSGNARSNRRR